MPPADPGGEVPGEPGPAGGEVRPNRLHLDPGFQGVYDPRQAGSAEQGFQPWTPRQLPDVAKPDEARAEPARDVAEQAESVKEMRGILQELKETIEGQKETIAQIKEASDKVQEATTGNRESMQEILTAIERIEKAIPEMGALR
jgi:hypothetical protein